MVADQSQTMYYIVARELPVAIALEDVSYDEAVAVASQCVADGQVLTGPDDGPVGYVVNFDQVAGLTVTSRKPPGPAMQMPTDLITTLIAKSAEDFATTPDDVAGSDSDEAMIAFYRARLDDQDCIDTDAKRELLAEYEQRLNDEAHDDVALATERRVLRNVIRRLIRPYADHPHYRPAWRP